MTEVWCYFFKSSRTISIFNFSTTTQHKNWGYLYFLINIFSPLAFLYSYAFLFTPFPLSERPKEDNNGFTPISLALILGLRPVFLPHEWWKERVTKPYELLTGMLTLNAMNFLLTETRATHLVFWCISQFALRSHGRASWQYQTPTLKYTQIDE